MFSEWPSAIAAWSSWRTIRLLFATGRRTRVSLICVHSLPKRSSTASYSTCCPKALSRCATSAFLHLAAANAWLLCANSSSRNTRRTWEFQKPHQSQLIQLQSQSCVAQVVASRCFFSALFNLRGAVHHEPHRFLPPLSTGCWISVLHPYFYLHQTRNDPTQPLCCRVFRLRWLAYWMYNLFR